MQREWPRRRINLRLEFASGGYDVNIRVDVGMLRTSDKKETGGKEGLGTKKSSKREI